MQYGPSTRTFFASHALRPITSAATKTLGPQRFSLTKEGIGERFFGVTTPDTATAMDTTICTVSPWRLGRFTQKVPSPSALPLEDWHLELAETEDSHKLSEAVEKLRDSAIPVAFPTETVYGLGADATRSEAVQGIYTAKQRPSDNPLIVHIASINQLRALLGGNKITQHQPQHTDIIPEIYKPLIRKFWPGPLTILLPVPDQSPLALETTAGLKTFGARMPRNLLALALIKLADRPIAAPSANASTKPSPTAAEHVLHDLDGRVELILDGGPCSVGVESTVVDGLSDPPCILRPGGVSIGELRKVPGWENVRVAYEDQSQGKAAKEGPRAPGMKYRHYSPKAKVVLFEHGRALIGEDVLAACGDRRRVGIVRTKQWVMLEGSGVDRDDNAGIPYSNGRINDHGVGKSSDSDSGLSQLPEESPLAQMLREQTLDDSRHYEELTLNHDVHSTCTIVDVQIGPETGAIARSLFSALRDLDKKDLDAILVEGIPDGEGDDVSAAVMNRLRKAAEVNVS